MRRTLSILSIMVLTGLGLLAFVPMASANVDVCTGGAGSGQCASPLGVAVDKSAGKLYVADFGNNRVDVFDVSPGGAVGFAMAFGWGVADGTTAVLQSCGPGASPPTVSCFRGIAGAGAGQMRGPERIVVDEATHSVYVGETQNNRIQKFSSSGDFLWMVGGEVNKATNANFCSVSANCGAGISGEAEGFFLSTFSGVGVPIALAPSGNLVVADSKSVGASSEGFSIRIQRFEPNGNYLGPQMFLPGGVTGRAQDLAIDSTGAMWVATNNPNSGIRKYTSGGSELGITIDGTARSLAVAASDHLLTGPVGFENGAAQVREYDADGTLFRVIFGSEALQSVARDLAVFSTPGGDLFVSQANSVLYIPLPDPGPLFSPGTTEATSITAVKATLQTTFNPQGKPSTVRFEYVDKASFEEDGDEFDSLNTQITPESAPSPGVFTNVTRSSTNVCVVPSETTCLDPETTYYFRAIAKNADGEVIGEKAEFTTKAAHEIETIWSTEVGTDTARLHALVNPLGIQATGHFQYIAAGPDYEANGFDNALDSPTFALGSGEVAVTKAAQLQGLAPGTIYHYRVVVENPYFPSIVSGESSFATFASPGGGGAACSNQPFRTGPSAALPDCRAYEMVTPVDKDNGDVLTRINITGLPTNLDQSAVNGNGFAFTSYRAFDDPQSAPYTNQYLAARTERGQAGEGWSSENVAPPRSGHFRNGELENEFQAFSPDLSRSWILQEGEPTLDPCAAAGFSGLYQRESATGAYQALSCATPNRPVAQANIYMPELQGASADGSKALIRIDDKLTEDASSATVGSRPIYQLYESVGAGVLRLVSVLPNGQASGVDSSAGTALSADIPNHNRQNSVAKAISEDGTRVFWSAGVGSKSGDVPTVLYLRLNSDQVQSKINSGECTQPFRACTIPVSGTVTSEPSFFQAANPQGTEALFTVTAGPLAGNLYRFTSEAEPPASELVAEGVMGNILGASEDLSKVYFASTKASAQAQSEGATPGQPNVYLDEEGETRFLATLSTPATASPYSDIGSLFGTPTATEPINRTARVSPDGQSLVFMSNSPALAEQVAGYDNTDVASGQDDFEVYRYGAQADALACVSCNPSGARPRGREIAQGLNGNVGPYAAATIPLFQNQHFQPRYLSDDGNRVYFNSFEALVLRDTNGAQDVYQWAAPGSGSCTSQSSSYVQSSEGCLSLISSGQSPEDSKFLDATPSGSDVFFSTGEGLLVQDYGLIDVYDARVGGGFPPPPNPPAACEGEACQGPLEAPNDPTPSSSTFQGAGNVVEEPAAKKKKQKAKAKKKKTKKAKQQAKKRQQQRANANRRNHR